MTNKNFCKETMSFGGALEEVRRLGGCDQYEMYETIKNRLFLNVSQSY